MISKFLLKEFDENLGKPLKLEKVENWKRMTKKMRMQNHEPVTYYPNKTDLIYGSIGSQC